jgi:hypothetical protein
MCALTGIRASAGDVGLRGWFSFANCQLLFANCFFLLALLLAILPASVQVVWLGWRRCFEHRRYPWVGLLLLPFGSSFPLERSRPRLRPLFFRLLLFLPAGLSPVGYLGQELVDLLNFFFRPDMYGFPSILDAFGSRKLARTNVYCERVVANA